MKKLYLILTVAMLFGMVVPGTKAVAGVSVDFFYNNLDAYGDWREVGDYGYCWQPRNVDSDWRPYSDGHWLYTDAGWTWDSDEPFSWAVYHYGRWARVDQIGWVWVPGTEWGPAWVSWRRSPGYVGWAPLPPEAEFNRSSGFSNRVDAEFDIGPANYSFVEVRNFGAPRLRSVIVGQQENISIIQQTTNITRVTYVNNVVFNGGPQYDVISRESSQPIRRLKLDRRQDLNGDPGSMSAAQLRTRVDGDSFRVVAPAFDATTPAAPHKTAAKVQKIEVDHGWKNAGPPAEVEKMRTRIKSEPSTPAGTPVQSRMEQTPVVPVVTSTPPPAQGVNPVERKKNNFAQPMNSPEPVTTRTAPGNAGTPDEFTKPGKQPKHFKPAKTEDVSPQTSPAAAVMPERMKANPAMENAKPAPQQPAVGNIDRGVPGSQEPRVRADKAEKKLEKQQAAAVKQDQQGQTANEEKKGKGKDKNKGQPNPESTPQ